MASSVVTQRARRATAGALAVAVVGALSACQVMNNADAVSTCTSTVVTSTTENLMQWGEEGSAVHLAAYDGAGTLLGFVSQSGPIQVGPDSTFTISHTTAPAANPIQVAAIFNQDPSPIIDFNQIEQGDYEANTGGCEGLPFVPHFGLAQAQTPPALDIYVNFPVDATGFTASDLVISGTAGASNVSVNALSATLFRVVVADAARPGSITVTLPAGAVNGEYNSVNSEHSATYAFAPQTGPAQVTLHANDGSDDSLQAPATTWSPFTLPVTTFARDGYALAGWATEPVASQAAHASGATVELAGGDLALYAVWSPTPYTATFDPAGGSIGGDSATHAQPYDIESAAFAAPVPARPGYTFDGWTGTGLSSPATVLTIPTGSTGDRVYTASWTRNAVATLAVTGPTAVAEGDSASYLVEGFDAGGVSLGDVTGEVTLASSSPADAVAGTGVTFGFDPAGLGGGSTRTVTATLAANPAVTGVLDVTAASAASGLRIDGPATVAQGGSVTVTVAAVDGGGGVLGDVSHLAVVSSDVPTDMIDGTTVTFPHASPHTLTVTAGGLSATFLVEVVPTEAPSPENEVEGEVPVADDEDAAAPVASAATGQLSDTGATRWAGTMAMTTGALLLGAALVVVARRRTAV